MWSGYCAPCGGFVVARPVRLQQVPLLRRDANQGLELVRHELRDALHVLAQPALPFDRDRRTAHTEVAVSFEVRRRRDEWRPRAQRQRGRTRGQQGALAEEFHLDASPTDVAITQETDDVVGLER